MGLFNDITATASKACSTATTVFDAGSNIVKGLTVAAHSQTQRLITASKQGQTETVNNQQVASITHMTATQRALSAQARELAAAAEEHSAALAELKSAYIQAEQNGTLTPLMQDAYNSILNFEYKK